MKSTLIALPEDVWREKQRAHEQRVLGWTSSHLERAARGERHPVYDFLYEYYSFRPSWFKRWHPGLGVALQGNAAEGHLAFKGYHRSAEGVTADPATLAPHRWDTLRWLRTLLSTMQSRPALFGCFGLHEWAMVYRLPQDQIRHFKLPLRFSPEEIARFVESQVLCCTHFDAFRFFTPDARPLNRHFLERPLVPAYEQRGCLHANMDLYKWSFKLTPFAPSELTADCFDLAVRIRELDMQASPYDCSSLGFEAVKVETPQGRQEYEARQRAFSKEGEPLRERLLAVVEQLLALEPERQPRSSGLVGEDRPAETH